MAVKFEVLNIVLQIWIVHQIFVLGFSIVDAISNN